MKIRAVIFDMDGVLIDAKEWHYDALNQALKLFGSEISRYDHLITFDGLPTKKKLEMLSIDGSLPKKLHGFINELKQQYTMEIVYTKCKPIFQHQYALSMLQAEEYKLAVCSNSIRKTVEVMMEKAALSHYLEFFFSNEDVSNGKPDPEMYQLAMTRLGLTPEECLIVEDNDNGIKAALASGAHLLKVKGPEDVTFQNLKQRIKEIENA